jgi:hypothetical protein
MKAPPRQSWAPAIIRTTASGLALTIGVLLCVLVAGCRHATHSVTLNWKAPPAEAGVQVRGYNIYRSTTPGGPFVKLAGGVFAPHYEDRLVNSGRTYFYVVTAVDPTGRESRFSTEVRAEIP